VDGALAVTCIRGRTSDRTEGGGRGAEALARRLGGRVVGEPGDAAPRDWREDLPAARPALEAARAAIEEAGGARPVLTASDCTICLATFPAVAALRPDVRFVWFDAHGDFNTPETTPSGFLGGMCLAAACGRWDAGWGPAVEPGQVHLIGGRDLDLLERVEVERAGLERDLPEGGPVYVHLDVDVLDPSVLPSQFPVPGGMDAASLRAALAQLAETCEVVGLEVTAFEAPEDPGELERRTDLVARLASAVLA
jgi:arginase family enzyme